MNGCKKKVDSVLMNGESMRKEALRICYQEVVCLFCNKSGGLMKKVNSNQDEFGGKVDIGQGGYYHVFCAFAFGKYKTLSEMRAYHMHRKFQNFYNSNQCSICLERTGSTLSCHKCSSRPMHPLCAWLAGHHFDLISHPSAIVHAYTKALDFSALRDFPADAYMPVSQNQYSGDPLQSAAADVNLWQDNACHSDEEEDMDEEDVYQREDMFYTSAEEGLADDTGEEIKSEGLSAVASGHKKQTRYYQAFPA